MARLPEMRIENAKILFRNFKGEERRDPKNNKIVNEAGCRNFCVQIDDQDAEMLKANHWNIKQTKPSDEYDGVLYYLPVEVKFDPFPPTIDMFTKHNRTRLTEDTVDILDAPTVIKSADIVINPYAWSAMERSGIKAYLSKAYVVIEEDDWEEKYASWGGPEE